MVKGESLGPEIKIHFLIQSRMLPCAFCNDSEVFFKRVCFHTVSRFPKVHILLYVVSSPSESERYLDILYKPSMSKIFASQALCRKH